MAYYLRPLQGKSSLGLRTIAAPPSWVRALLLLHRGISFRRSVFLKIMPLRQHFQPTRPTPQDTPLCLYFEGQRLSLRCRDTKETWVVKRCPMLNQTEALVSKVSDFPNIRSFLRTPPHQGCLTTTDASRLGTTCHQKLILSAPYLTSAKNSPQSYLLICVCLCRLQSTLG